MIDPFNRFNGVCFSRTQPREWRDIPFEGDTKRWPMILRIVGIALLWLSVLGLSLWSINQQAADHNYYTKGIK